jgi:hypothetical protein
MEKTLECPHPTQDLMIVPTTTKFAWIDKDTYEYHLEIVSNRMGNHMDCADTHIGIIQNAPVRPGVKLATGMVAETNEDTESDQDAEGVSDDDHEGSTDFMLGNGDSGVNPAVDAILSTIREQKAHYVTYRSTCMREDNRNIKAAATLAPGACNPIHSFKPINI